MSLRANYQKFKKHLKSDGILYAFWRGIKYFIFLIKRQRDKFKESAKNIISKGKIKIAHFDYGISIAWSDSEVTKGAGLNIAINTLGLWTDSTKADWQILAKERDYLKVKVVFKYLPLSQIWTIHVKNEQEIDWQVDIDIEEQLHIDEFCIVSMVNPRYKTYVSNYQQADFPRLDNHWRDLYSGDLSASLVGVRFPIEGEFLPSFILETQNKNMFPIIQNPPLQNNTHIIGFRHIDSEEKRDYLPGSYHLFSGKISLFEDDYCLDDKIENLRKESLGTVIREKTKDTKSRQRPKVLLANLPWQRQGRWGVRAGSRWPHIKDKSEGNYLPFPFFLAYAASLLQKHNIEVSLIDAIAEQIPEDSFIQKILAMNFDYLVTETSIPSFYDDLNILKKISEAGISIVLCGPNPEIYKPEFLKEHQFIDYVLYGEYEYTLLELIASLKKNKDLSRINGLIYKDDNKVVKNPARPPFDINLLPWPYREGLPMEKYWDLPGNIPHPSAQMIASRGCPFGCNFCLWPQVIYQGNHYRIRNIDDVVNEMEYLVKEKKFESVYFDDDTFNIGKERMLKICQAIKERALQNTPWAIMARPDLMDKEILTEMKSAGLWAVKYGVESCSQSLIKNCQKKLNLEKTTHVINLTKDLGIKTHLTFCFGFLGETKETIQETIDYSLSLGPDSVQFSILTPFPGTRLFEELDRQGKILTRDWSKYDGHYNCVFKPDNLSPKDLEEAKRKAYRLWGEHVRKKRGLWGDIIRFKDYIHEDGFKCALYKTLDYLVFIWIRRREYLNAKD